MHSDVGGGNGNRGLNWIALNWMFGDAKRAGLPIKPANVMANLADKGPAAKSRSTMWLQAGRKVRTTDRCTRASSWDLAHGLRHNNPTFWSRIDNAGVLRRHYRILGDGRRPSMSHDKEWYQLPHAAALARLIEVRDELRGKTSSTPKAGIRSASIRFHSRPGTTKADSSCNDILSADGKHRLRFGRNFRWSGRSRIPRTLHTQSENRQSGIFTRTVFQPRKQRIGGGVDSIQVRLVRTQGDPKDSHEIALPATIHGPTADARAGTPVDPPGWPVQLVARVSASRVGGTDRRYTAARRRRRSRFERVNTAKSVGSDGDSKWMPPPVSIDGMTETWLGLVFCTACLRSSTTPSAISCEPATRCGRTSGCFSRRA